MQKKIKNRKKLETLHSFGMLMTGSQSNNKQRKKSFFTLTATKSVPAITIVMVVFKKCLAKEDRWANTSQHTSH